ncbi:MAG: OB-fold domain-containing protein [Parasporobacterium sp.]|nr:OB-fold domain-containing protein [Parasporobacterium sp.]
MGVKLERIVKTYYDNLAEGKITARKCKECGAVEWPPLLGCNTCGSPEMEWIEISGKAKLVQFVMSSPITRKPEMEDIKPYALGVVDLPEGPSVNVMVRGIDRRNKDIVREQMPVDVHATIIPRDGYHTVIFDLDVVPEGKKRERKPKAE